MGFALDQGKYGQPEIRGYSAEYLQASSPRRQQIVERLEEQGFSGATAAQIAAHQARGRKQVLSREEVLMQHRQMAAKHGNQPEQVVADAVLRTGRQSDSAQIRREPCPQSHMSSGGNLNGPPYPMSGRLWPMP